jgi:O-antigen/teichoic acid export membrane protein
VFGARWEVSVAVIQILSFAVIIRGLQSWGSIYLDAIGRPEVTWWTQLASLCLTPVAVVIGVHWGIEGIAVCYVASQVVAVEIPIFVIVLSQMRVSPKTVARRLSGVALASLIMAVSCLLGRSALEAAGVGMAPRAALAIGFGVAVYLPALWWLAPEASRPVSAIARRRLRSLLDIRRRPVTQP